MRGGQGGYQHHREGDQILDKLLTAREKRGGTKKTSNSRTLDMEAAMADSVPA